MNIMPTTEEKRFYQRKWEREHRKMTPQRKQAMKIRSRRCYELHRETILERHKAYGMVHSEQLKEYKHRYYLAHQDSIDQRREMYRATHKEQVNVEQKARYHIPIEGVCELCGSQKNLERHHPNYGAPLAVEIICRSCHRKIHCQRSYLSPTTPKLTSPCIRGRIGTVYRRASVQWSFSFTFSSYSANSPIRLTHFEEMNSRGLASP